MNARFGSVCVAAAVAVALFEGAADAQVISLDQKSFAAGPAKVQPQGNWSVAANSGEWRIEVDYGTLKDGAFVRDATIGVGGTFKLPATTDGEWKQTDIETLKKPLGKDGAVRARLQKKDAQGKWVDEAAAYQLPTAQPKKSGS